MKFTPTKFEIYALRKYIEENKVFPSVVVTCFKDEPEPGPMLFNATVYEVAKATGLNIFDVAGDIQSTAYYAKLDTMPYYQSQGHVEFIEGDEPEFECEPGFNDKRCHDCHCGECRQ